MIFSFNARQADEGRSFMRQSRRRHRSAKNRGRAGDDPFRPDASGVCLPLVGPVMAGHWKKPCG
jgi:hypothetical protein